MAAIRAVGRLGGWFPVLGGLLGLPERGVPKAGVPAPGGRLVERPARRFWRRRGSGRDG